MMTFLLIFGEFFDDCRIQSLIHKSEFVEAGMVVRLRSIPVWQSCFQMVRFAANSSRRQGLIWHFLSEVFSWSLYRFSDHLQNGPDGADRRGFVVADDLEAAE